MIITILLLVLLPLPRLLLLLLLLLNIMIIINSIIMITLRGAGWGGGGGGGRLTLRLSWGAAACISDLPLQGIPLQAVSLYKGFPFTRDFHLQGISIYRGFPFTRDFHLQGISLYKGYPFTPNLPTSITPTKIAWLKTSGKFPMGLGIPRLKTKIMLESSPPKSTMLVGKLAV